MTLESIQTLISEWWPIMVAGSVTVMGVLGAIYLFYTQASAVVKPIIDKISDFRKEDEEKLSIASVLENIKIDTLKADLLYKIQNDTVSPELTMIYQAQLDKLIAITDKTNEVIEKVEEKTNPYL